MLFTIFPMEIMQKYFFLSYQALAIDDPEILGQKKVLLRPSLIHVHHFDDY